jgi:hypothetical protein
MYWPGHLLMYPDSATGQYSYTFEIYPAPNKDWIPREPISMASGVIAGTNGSGGFWPRMEIRLKDGYITEVKGGGVYGDVIRQFLDYPRINDLTYPYYNHPGYWHLWEVALGTNPKFSVILPTSTAAGTREFIALLLNVIAPARFTGDSATSCRMSLVRSDSPRSG